MAIKVQIRRDDSAIWTSINPILLNGEMGYELDTAKLKIGNGINNWNDLPYVGIDGKDFTYDDFTIDQLNALKVKGDKGNDGERGIDGAFAGQGYSAYQVAVINGYVGTEAEWLLSLKGEQGIQGIQGNIGNIGETGERGLSGKIIKTCTIENPKSIEYLTLFNVPINYEVESISYMALGSGGKVTFNIHYDTTKNISGFSKVFASSIVVNANQYNNKIPVALTDFPQIPSGDWVWLSATINDVITDFSFTITLQPY